MTTHMTLLLVSLVFGMVACARNIEEKRGKEVVFTIQSKAFSQGGKIPSKYTGDGVDISPDLQWTGVPPGVKSFALVMDDPDAPVGIWVHWVLYNIPETARELSEGVPKTESLENGARQGLNDFGKLGYGGPYPPKGTPHHYYFKLYALDALLQLPPRITKEGLMDAMKGHIISETKIVGIYER